MIQMKLKMQKITSLLSGLYQNGTYYSNHRGLTNGVVKLIDK